MYRITLALLTFFSIASARAQITDEMFLNFNRIKVELLKIDLSKSENDQSYMSKMKAIEKAFETANSAYLATAQKNKTGIIPDIATSMNRVAVELGYLRTPVDLIEKKFSQEACYSAWYEMNAPEPNDAELFKLMRTFNKTRCKAEYTPGI